MVATKRILVVDDEEVVCRSYERVLGNAGFAVEKAHDGAGALDHIAHHDYDVMLADLRMPGMDGMQLVRQLRQTHPDLPVVLITGYPSQDTLQEAARLGVTDYLTKPVAPDVLTEATTQAMTGRPWRAATHYLATATLPATNAVVPAAVVPAALPAAPIVAPERAAAPAAKRAGVLGSTMRLAGGLALSLAYVMFLPLAGFFVLFGLGTKALVGKLMTRPA